MKTCHEELAHHGHRRHHQQGPRHPDRRACFAPDGSTFIPELLRVGRCHFPAVELLMLKDSLLFDDGDQEAIAAAVARAEEDAVVITHGTGTMGETARFLEGRCPGKAVVLT